MMRYFAPAILKVGECPGDLNQAIHLFYHGGVGHLRCNQNGSAEKEGKKHCFHGERF
jgi:hypothetical protein